MSTQDFVVRIADLDAGPQRVQQPLGTEWLSRALSDTEGEPWPEEGGSSVSGPSAGWVDLEVAKNGRQILVRGRIRARVVLPCARTLDPAHYELEPQVFLVLHPSAEEALRDAPSARRGAERAARGEGRAERRKREGAGNGGKEGAGESKKGKRRGDWSEDPELTEEDAAVDTYAGEQVVLDDFIREFIVLEFPMFPLREDLRSDAARASSALPNGVEASGAEANAASASGPEASQLKGEKPLDPRLSPLAELKARLEKKE